MASEEHRFRLGKISATQGLPQMGKLNKILSGQEIMPGTPGDRRGIRRVSYDEEAELLFFVYIEEQKREFTSLNEEGEITTQKMYPLSTAKCVLSDNTIVFESTQGIIFQDIISQIFQTFSVSPEAEVIEEIDRKAMLSFFENSLDSLKKYKVKEIGEHEPPTNPIDVTGRARDVVDGTRDVLDSLLGSVGREGDADDELSKALIGLSVPDRLRGEDNDGRIRELYRSGRAVLRYDDEQMDDEEEANLIREFVYESYSDHIRSNGQ